MRSEERNPRFGEFVASTDLPLASLTPRMGLELILRYCAKAQVGHVLLYSWTNTAVYGTEKEVGFNYNLVEPDAYDYDRWELKFKFGPGERADGQEGGGLIWGCFPEDLETFLAKVENSSPAFRNPGDSQASAVALVDGCDVFPLFDCWGVRDPSRPIVHMTEDEWSTSDDTPLMLRWFHQQWRGEQVDLDRLLHRYCLACCRRIWRLLPDEESRAAVEVAERSIDGLATVEEIARANWFSEGAAFAFERPDNPMVSAWVDDASRIPRDEMNAMLQSPRPDDDLSPAALLSLAAYFVSSAFCYPGLRPIESIEDYRLFLSAPLLREMVGDPFRPAPDRIG